MKYYDYADKALIEKKLYNLLPLQLFLLRAELEKAAKEKDEQARQSAVIKAKEMIDKIFAAVTELHEEQKIDDNDYDKISSGLAEIIKHLDTRYNLNNALIGGIEMIKTLADKKILKQATQAKENLAQAEENRSIDIAKNLLDILDVETIAERTKLTVEKVKELKKEALNQSANN